jgi:hypothetical protein
MHEREELIERCLAGAGWSGAKRSALAGDASFRHYQRLRLAGESAVLMDAPPPEEDVAPFIAIARHLQELGLSAPRILAEDVEGGLLVLEDLGDLTYTRALKAGDDPRILYDRAVDLLIELHKQPSIIAIPPGLTSYDREKLLAEAALFIDWYMPPILGKVTVGELRNEYLRIWRDLAGLVEGQPETLVLRDFHADNLMWLAERPGIAACGLLDFQDAVCGPPAYDLMSLFEDARLDLSPELVGDGLGRYLDGFPELDRANFITAYSVLAAQRHCKVIGIFTRLSVRDGKHDYLRHIPRVWHLLEKALRHPALAALHDWLAVHLPAAARTNPVRTKQV